MDNLKKIKLIISDIDGVLTNGKVALYPPYDGAGCKTLCFKDFDAVAMLNEIGIQLCIVTGERDAFVDEVVKRFKPLYFVSGCKEKDLAIYDISKRAGVSLDEMAYVGDGKYDIPAIKLVGLGMCPADAIKDVRELSDMVLDVDGGSGCLSAAYYVIKEYNRLIKNG